MDTGSGAQQEMALVLALAILLDARVTRYCPLCGVSDAPHEDYCTWEQLLKLIVGLARGRTA
jgi:hypothetical protein